MEHRDVVHMGYYRREDSKPKGLLQFVPSLSFPGHSVVPTAKRFACTPLRHVVFSAFILAAMRPLGNAFKRAKAA